MICMSRQRTLPHYEHEAEIVACIKDGMTYQETLDTVYGVKNRYSINSLSRFLNSIDCFSRNFKGGGHSPTNIYKLPECRNCPHFETFEGVNKNSKPIHICTLDRKAVPRDLKLSPVWCKLRGVNEEYIQKK